MLVLSGCSAAAQPAGPKVYTQGKLTTLPAGVPLYYPHLAGCRCDSPGYLPAQAKPVRAFPATAPGLGFWQIDYTCHPAANRAQGIFVMEVPDPTFPAEDFGVTERVHYRGLLLLAGVASLAAGPQRAMAFRTGEDSTFLSLGKRVTRPAQVDLTGDVSLRAMEKFAASMHKTP